MNKIKTEPNEFAMITNSETFFDEFYDELYSIYMEESEPFFESLMERISEFIEEKQSENDSNFLEKYGEGINLLTLSVMCMNECTY